MEGWIKIHRKIMEWEWFDDANLFKFFIGLILLANHDSAKWHGITVRRGEIVTSRERLASQFNFSEQQIRTMLKKLQNSGEITIKPTNKYTILNICNYDSCQCADVDNQPTNQPTNNQQITNNQPTNNQQITTNKNDKNVKNENNEKNINADKSATREIELFDVEPIKKETRNKYGEYKNVLLTKEEFETLNSKYGQETAGIIDNYSQYKEMKGYKCKRDYLAIIKWGVNAYREAQHKLQARHIDTSERDNRNIEGIWK